MLQGDEDQYKKIIQRYKDGLCTELELQAFFGLLTEDTLDAELAGQMDEEIAGLLSTQPDEKRVLRSRRLWPMISAAAVILIALLTAILFNYRDLSGKPDQVAFDKDILPGKNQAMLKLANGKTIYLSGASQGIVFNPNGINYSDGTPVAGETNLPMQDEQLTATTPRGGQYQLTLPDGTKVWLNAASSITFPGSFEGRRERNVEISGEVYFEVAKASIRGQHIPFAVSSAGQKLEVLGTHFNINSYADEAMVKTTLLEGAVRIVDKNGHEAILKPGEQASVGERSGIKVAPVAISNQVAWKNGDFLFEEESLGAILRQVARWYDVDISYQDPELQHEQFVAFSTRYANVSTLLNKLQQAGKAAFRIEGGKIIVSKK